MDFTDLAKEFMALMYKMRKRNVQKQLSDSLHGERFALFYISKHEGNVIPSDISNEMGISSARVAAALNSLETKGLILRRIDGEDRRRIIVKLTEAGREQVEAHNRKVIGITANMLGYLGEEDARELLRIMKKLSDKCPQDFDEMQN